MASACCRLSEAAFQSCARMAALAAFTVRRYAAGSNGAGVVTPSDIGADASVGTSVEAGGASSASGTRSAGAALEAGSTGGVAPCMANSCEAIARHPIVMRHGRFTLHLPSRVGDP